MEATIIYTEATFLKSQPTEAQPGSLQYKTREGNTGRVWRDPYPGNPFQAQENPAWCRRGSQVPRALRTKGSCDLLLAVKGDQLFSDR